ncbi:hypothetical protein Ngar_c06210 [Candidatus Nitrososphaera gargensis Ga9.2]|uniref:Uncharacterized protein n=1 Tax=Nitrososphaera gargensis (strain Ga9.2) TaxID=1237085 RepID=K0IM52_NITGG|nr:hypothetical protein Ngar_c06210 [Candidatus Nitrososphaera gargensis Ga9.2]
MEPTTDENQVKQMQLVLSADSITLHASLMPGVLTTQTFEGTDCYAKFINFLKHVSANGIPISAEITVR